MAKNLAGNREPEPTGGIRCKKCGCQHHEVYGTKRLKKAGILRRYRKCRFCGHKFCTIERVDER